jgi:hypothetical protein
VVLMTASFIERFTFSAPEGSDARRGVSTA